MNQQHQEYYQQVLNLVQDQLTPVLMGKLEGQKQLVEVARKSLADYYNYIGHEESKVEVLEMVRKMKNLKESMVQSVNSITLINNAANLDEEFSQYFEELNLYAKTLPESILEEQSIDRFQPLSNDNFKIKIGKRIKKWGLLLGWLPQRIANWFRIKGNKPIKPLKLWKQEVPLRGMILYHFRDLLVEQLIDMVQAINRIVASSTHKLYEIESSLDQKFAGMISEEVKEQIDLTSAQTHSQTINEIQEKIDQLSDSVGAMMTNRIERIFGMFQTNYELVGTIELSVNNFNEQGLKSAQKDAIDKYAKTMGGWNNTIAVLSDRYNFDHELFKTRFANLEQYLFVSQKLETKISEKLLSKIDAIAKFLDAKQQQLAGDSSSEEDFKKLLKEIRYETSRFLKQTIPDCIKVIRELNIPALIENLETKVINQVSQLSDTRSMVKNISYEHAIKESDIHRIAPKDLITFEALPEYLARVRELASEVNEVVEMTQKNLMEISNICDFNLETALAAIDGNSQYEKAKTMSIEGIERAHSRLQDIAEDLQALAVEGDQSLRDGVMEFNSRIKKLNEIDQVFDTQVRIAKAMAVEKTKALRKQLIDKFKEFIPRLITNTRRRGLMLYKRYREASQKYGIATPVQTLSAEVSGFLSDTQTTINSLPFVYQRLFEITPLENLYFYEPRNLATLSLKKAFENWEEGHFGATTLIAETGSGVTTLLYFFLQELKVNLPVIKLSTTRQIYSVPEFFEFFEQQFETESIEDTDALVSYLNQLSGKRIIIMEDLEHFFLRKVNGFDCIRIFLEVVARTNQNIFWVVTINQYSYQYLSSTIDIDDYFSVNIELQPLKPAQVTSLVLKRHRVSGFSLHFRPHKLDRKNKRFKKMDEEQQQEYLQAEYFNALNRIAQSNITLALVYWLRSITQIQDDVMFIRSIKGIDFSFLLELSDHKLYTLHSMLLHDGITIPDHSIVFQQTQKKSKLNILPLFDDGIVVNKEGRFYINPLLFRAVVTLLRDKNILH